MNSEGLALQAAGLPCRAQGIVGLGATWLLVPLLEIDQSDQGRHRSAECIELLELAVGGPHGDGVDALRKTVADAPEIRLDEEPEGPAAYRLDFLVALLYALEATAGGADALGQCLTRVGDSFYFAVDAGLLGAPPPLDDALLRLIDTLSEARPGLWPSVGEVRQLLQQDYDAIAIQLR